jgi:hypothetical protein
MCLMQRDTSPLQKVDQAVDCGMLSHSSLMAVRSCWILAGTGTHCRTRWSRASQTCSMGDMSGEYADHGRTGTFQLPGIVYRYLRHGAVHYHAETWGDCGGWMARQDLITVSLCIQIAIKSNCVHCLLSIPNPHRHHGALSSQLRYQQTSHPYNAIHMVCGCEAGWTYYQIF